MRRSAFEGMLVVLTLTIGSQAANVSTGGQNLSVGSVPPPGAQGYVFYALGAPDNTNSTTATGQASGGNLASPVPFVTINTAGDQYLSSSTQNGGYSNLTVNGATLRTGVAYQPVQESQSAVLATVTLGSQTPSGFRLGVLVDNAPGPQNNMASVSVAGSNTLTTQVAGVGSGASNDFYFFDISNAHPGDMLTVTVTNNGASGQFAFADLGGLTFDSVPEPTTLLSAALAASIVLRRRNSWAR